MTYYQMAFIPAEEGGFSILSPDFRELASQGDSLEECMDMAMDALALVTEAYAKTGRELPAPSGLNEARAKILDELRDLGIHAQPDDIVFQMVAAPDTSLTPVRISATFTRRTLDIIDAKARRAGMTRSGFLAAAAQAYA